MTTTNGGVRKAPPLTEPFSMEAAALHGRLPAHKRLVTRTIVRIQEALAAHPGEWGCSASGGKDTTAMVGVAVEAGWRGPLFHFRYRESHPETEALVHALGERYGLPVHVTTVAGAFDAFDRAGGFFTTPETEAQKEAVRWLDRTFRKDASAYPKAQGWVGLMLGLRAEESQARRMMLCRKGTLYAAEGRSWVTLCPMASWSARDVWGFIASRDLPHLPRYGYGDRTCPSNRSEDYWACVDLWAKGQAERIRRMDPSRWNELRAMFPLLDVEK